MVGEGDRSGRLAYWVMKSKSETPVLLPGDGGDLLQFVDVNDVASFILRCAEQRVFGDFNLSGPSISWTTFAELLGIDNGRWVDVATNEREEAALSFRELPLFRPRGIAEASFMNISNQKARASGFSVTDVQTTLQSFANWMHQHGAENITPEDIRSEFLAEGKEALLISGH
ncbi:hypothetical protein CS022_14080 [Veronia nyctiphanis]|uniref:Uncharacterized protein n=1 Tax=Veronia nyctiphanis TaxID=1278244 RepID=A0A4Q0YU89_9GAMM|nr:hypothetical protein CS022_14080 [Veronia nyctiphanis]